MPWRMLSLGFLLGEHKGAPDAFWSWVSCHAESFQALGNIAF